MGIAQHLGWRYLWTTIGAAVAVALLLAIPAAIIDNPLFARMTPVEPEQYVFWALTSLFTGALIATYVDPRLRHGLAGSTVGAGLLGLFAVSCPVCNKVVVALVGTSGASSYFAPVQPLLGLAAVALAGWALWVRLVGLREASCRRPPAWR